MTNFDPIAEQIATESRVLSAWFYDAKFRRAWQPDAALFVGGLHRSVAEVCAAYGHELTETVLVLELRRRGAKMSPEAVADLIHGTPAVRDPWQAVQQLRDLNGLVALRHGLQRALAEVAVGSGLAKAQDATSDALVAAAAKRGATVLTVQGLLAKALERATRRDRKPGCSTGNVDVNAKTGGIRPGHVWVLGADTSWGKSSWLLMVADVNLRLGRKVLVVTGEDDPELYGQRLLARRARLNFWALRDGQLGAQSISAATRAVSDAETWPFMLDARGCDAEMISSEIRSLVVGQGIELVLVDYLQCMQCRKDFKGERRNEVAHIARTFTDAIKTTGAGGVLFSQITVDGKKKHPDKHSIRESRDVSNAAEVVLLGYSEQEGDGPEQRMLFVDKCKDGPRGLHVELPWNKLWAGFEADEDRELRLGNEAAE